MYLKRYSASKEINLNRIFPNLAIVIVVARFGYILRLLLKILISDKKNLKNLI